MKRMLFLINPRSGREQLRGKLMDILDMAVKAGYETEVYITQCRDDARRAARERGCGFDLVVCSGGDGTLNETVSGLMDGAAGRCPACLGEPLPGEKSLPAAAGPMPGLPPLGYIPSGSTNDFAASLGLRKDKMKAAADVFEGADTAIDVGKFGDDRYFVYIAAFGAFTEVSYATPQDRKNLLGHQAYMIEAVKRLPTLKSYAMRFETEDREIEGEFILGMVTNSLQVGGFKGLVGRNVALDDGQFEVLLVRTPKTPGDLASIASYFLMREGDNACVYQFKANRLLVTSQEPVDWTLDGEFGGAVSRVEIQNLQKALLIRRRQGRKTSKNVLKNNTD